MPRSNFEGKILVLEDEVVGRTGRMRDSKVDEDRGVGIQPSNGLEGKSGEGVRKAGIERKFAGRSMSMLS